MFFFSHPLASVFANANDVALLELSSHAIKLFCFTYLFRWLSMAAQSFFSAIEKPVQATIIAVGVALVFPVIMLGAFWTLGLDGIWLNMVGSSVLAAILAVVLLIKINGEIKNKSIPKHNLGKAVDGIKPI